MSPNRLSNLTIVVVEDHNDARRFLGFFLDRLGANAVLAGNAFEGLEAVKNNRPNLVLSDINMPGIDGFELLREIRALGPEAGGSVPVIAMTALITHADRARILNAGFQACLPKPFTPGKLVEVCEVPPNQPWRRVVRESQQMVMVHPNYCDKQIAHRVAQPSRPKRQKCCEGRLRWRLKVQHHDCDDHCKHAVRKRAQPLRRRFSIIHASLTSNAGKPKSKVSERKELAPSS